MGQIGTLANETLRQRADDVLDLGRNTPELPASVNDYCLDGHESIMRLLNIVVTEAADRPVTLCGELAGREAYVPRLLRMGFRALSVAPTIIPTTKAL